MQIAPPKSWAGLLVEIHLVCQFEAGPCIF